LQLKKAFLLVLGARARFRYSLPDEKSGELKQAAQSLALTAF
jgi:hypothetical protein